jgi:hypothetical protein
MQDVMDGEGNERMKVEGLSTSIDLCEKSTYDSSLIDSTHACVK